MLKGKTAIVTGGSRGIGEAIVYKLASMGADIALIYVGNSEIALNVCNNVTEKFNVKCISYNCDVSDFNLVKETIGQIKADFGGVNILVNNAGITKDGLIAMMKEEDYDKVLDINLKGTFNMIRHTSGLFIRAKEGCIINISSISGMMGNAGQCNYSASKAGVIGLTKSVARELASKNIRCNAIAPGFISTDMTKHLVNDELIKSIPLGRVGEVDDIADAVEYLVKAKYVTGEIIKVDGGMAI